MTAYKRKLGRFTIGLIILHATIGVAQDTNNIATTPGAAVAFTGTQVWWLMLAAVMGSLGTLGLLIGLDKVIMALVPRSSTLQKQYSADSIVKILPVVIYGITIILVVLAVLLLGLLRIASAEGALGILASIVGYVLGKSSSGRPQSDQDSHDTTTP